MLSLAVSGLSFSSPTLSSSVVASRSSAPLMAEPMFDRRAMFGAAAAAVSAAVPMAAFADGASSPAVLARARAIYGSRIVRLQDASPEAILEDKNAFTLFT